MNANELDMAMLMAAIGMISMKDAERTITPEQTARLRAWYEVFEEPAGMRDLTAHDVMEHILQKLGA